MVEERIILIDGIRYHADRPSNCKYCFFWKNRKKGCTLGTENCYYLAESPKRRSECEGCGYGSGSGPCPGFCWLDLYGRKGVNQDGKRA